MSVNPNDLAPAFCLPKSGDDIGATLSLEDLKGQWFVLYFYPKDDTPGCTQEACQFRDAYPEFSLLKVPVIGVSRDSCLDHEKFRHKWELPFILLSDESGEVCCAYGVWQERSMYGKKFMGIERSTFLIKDDGVIAAVWRKVKVPGHAQVVLQTIRELQSV
jgi:peroxiredoxin Q/BCP